MSGLDFKRMCQVLKVYPVGNLQSSLNNQALYVGGRFGGDSRQGDGILQHEEDEFKGLSQRHELKRGCRTDNI